MVLKVATANRQDITITGRTTVVELAERNQVEWQLSATPELEWAEILSTGGPVEPEGFDRVGQRQRA
jgi:hypothetical protein